MQNLSKGSAECGEVNYPQQRRKASGRVQIGGSGVHSWKLTVWNPKLGSSGRCFSSKPIEQLPGYPGYLLHGGYGGQPSYMGVGSYAIIRIHMNQSGFNGMTTRFCLRCSSVDIFSFAQGCKKWIFEGPKNLFVGQIHAFSKGIWIRRNSSSVLDKQNTWGNLVVTYLDNKITKQNHRFLQTVVSIHMYLDNFFHPCFKIFRLIFYVFWNVDLVLSFSYGHPPQIPPCIYTKTILLKEAYRFWLKKDPNFCGL